MKEKNARSLTIYEVAPPPPRKTKKKQHRYNKNLLINQSSQCE